MGKKKNLNHRDPDPLVKIPPGSDPPIPSSVNRSFKENCFGNDDAKNCLGLEPATQNGVHLNGVDPDHCAEKPQSCHTCPVKSSQTKAFELPMLNGTSSCDRTHGVNGLSEESPAPDSFSSDPSAESSKPSSSSTPSTSHCDANVTETSNVSKGDSSKAASTIEADVDADDVTYVVYESELQMPDIMRLIQKDLSEPYSIYTYRYFIHNWPHLCFMAHVGRECVGAIVCKLDFHKKIVKRGYIAMLAVDSKHRKKKIGSTLVMKAIQAMIAEDADEVVLETEITNKPALRLYENLGFVRDKRLFRYYLNGVDALRLKLWLR